MLIHGRYQLGRILGQGISGRVYEAYDTQTQSKCALKITLNNDEADEELRMLQTLLENDPQDLSGCIQLRDNFEFRNHTCIVTDLLSPSVFDFLQDNGFFPFPISQTQSFARQLLAQVAFLHDLDTIHIDLKPQNVLLVDPSYQTFTYKYYIHWSSTTVRCVQGTRRVLTSTVIRLIDFGSAQFGYKRYEGFITTRSYRAPEILLDQKWGKSCDLWSIGCILLQLHTGQTPFQADNTLEHLTMIERVTGGELDRERVRKARELKFDYPNSKSSESSKEDGQASRTLRDLVPATSPFNKHFRDLLYLLLACDPEKRPTAKQALEHP